LGVDGRAARNIAWVSPYGSVSQGGPITTDPQISTYAIPATATQTFTDAGGGTLVADNRGTWKVYTRSAGDGSARTITSFTVHDPAKAFVDLSVNQAVGVVESQVGSGSGSVFELFVTNNGPDTAQGVTLTDTLSDNATFSSIIADSGSGFSCVTPAANVTTCTAASMAAGTKVHFTLSYSVNAETPAGATISNNASVSSSATPCPGEASCEVLSDDNSSIATAEVPPDAGSPSCTLTCPLNMTVVANTTVSGEPGAYVNYAAAAGGGSCGAITNDPASSHEGAGGEILPGRFLSVGTHLITSSSESGDSCTFTITVTESTPPTITCPPNKTVSAASGETTATVDPGTPTTNPSTGVTVTFVRSDDLPNDGNPPPALSDPYPLGTTNITWTVTDAVGLTASCVQQITVVENNCAGDTTPPTITAPPDVTVGTGPDSVSCNVALDDELGQPTASDNCSFSISTSGVPAGNAFPVGTTNVTYTVTDGAGNTASAVQHVTVVDNTPPTITAPANASYTCPSQVPAASGSQATGVFDNCGTPTVTVSQSSSGAGSAASPLIIVRTYTATDSHGNSSSSVQTITVTDPTPPTFTFVPANVTAYTGPSATTCGTTVSDATLGTATASDNCSVTVTRSGVPAGNVFPKGNTTITYTATDSAGNAVTATQTVTVIDNTPPVLSCPANITVNLPLNSTATSMAVTYPAATATDNCPGTVTIGYSIASGTVFSVGTTPVTVTATDANGNSSSCTFTVKVLYNFTGFFSPVNNPPTLNTVNAGRAIPVKFSLSGNKGLGIFAPNNPYTVSLNCDSNDPGVDVTETVTAGGSSLDYSPDQYNYIWKTENSWAGTCRQLVITLNDGSVHVANFKFR